MSKRIIFLLLALTLITFLNCLGNGFVGDEEVFIVENTFYQSWENIGSLFTPDYFPNPNRVNHANQRYYSGSVAYRPVLSFTYFLDYWLWQLKAFGYHLKNIEIHLLNTLLVFLLCFNFFRCKQKSFFCAIIFAVHPVQLEAVNNIGYRADLLSTMFVLSSFLFYVRFCEVKKHRFICMVGSLLCYGLGLFSKESAIVLPGLIIAYDFYFKNCNIKDLLSRLLSKYSGYVLMSLFYVYIYFFVFPNQTLMRVEEQGADFPNMSWVFVLYVFDLCFPFLVKMIPPLYMPDLHPFPVFKIIFGLNLFLFFIFLVKSLYKKRSSASFFLLWFLLCLIPVSNVIPLANPMAHRFLYLPSVGFFIFLGLVLNGICCRLRSQQLGKITKFSFIGVCMAMTISLSVYWKSSLTVGEHLVGLYPKHAKAHAIVGSEYFKRGQCQKALKPLRKAIDLKIKDPRPMQMIKICQNLGSDLRK